MITCEINKCSYCGRDMETSKGCTALPFMFDGGEILEPIKFGDENKEELLVHERCPECGCEKGQVHHMGCDIEICPKCKGIYTKCHCDK